MSITAILLAKVFREPESIAALNGSDWSELIGQAGACGLLARLGEFVRSAGLWSAVPEGPRRHMISAAVVVDRQHDQVRRELCEILRVLSSLQTPVVVLKGGGYLAAELPAASGRLLSDIDIMVPKTAISRAETLLSAAGWISTENDEYNQRYYREWMHEVPPLRHIRRGTTIDLHHTILPPTARPDLDAQHLFERVEAVPGMAGLFVLSEEDRILHAAAHLFYDGELERGLRDLSDIRLLMDAATAAGPRFQMDLLQRAQKLGLSLELNYALHYLDIFFGPGKWRAHPMNFLIRWSFDRALLPLHPSCGDALSPLAKHYVYVRSHRLRMPFRLLIPHLIRKAWMRHQADVAARKVNE